MFAQDSALVDIADGQPARALRGERAGHLDCAMTIRVGLHHRHHFHARTDDVADRLKILGNLLVSFFCFAFFIVFARGQTF